ncbi:HEAT repeat domain-containing protein, partial [Simkania negevensis]|nr:HEAT repeat domain-containing protein [Simkania negevensis]
MKLLLSLTLLLVGLRVFGADIALSRVSYLAQQGEVEAAIALYRSWHEESASHDYTVLQRLGRSLIERGGASDTLEERMLAVYGAGIALLPSLQPIVEDALLYPDPQVQLIALHFLASFQTDSSSRALFHAMRSPFLLTRLEAAYLLAQGKIAGGTEQIEALMVKVDPEWQIYFPELFALAGDRRAVNALKRLMSHSNRDVRLMAILSAASFHRDDFTKQIKDAASQLDRQQREAAASALGLLGDLSALPLLQDLFSLDDPYVRIAAALSLHRFGNRGASALLEKEALAGNLFAIAALEQVADSEDLLVELLDDSQIHVRLNAALSLLQHKDSRCVEVLKRILIADARDLAFTPTLSPGKSLRAWKAVPSAHSRYPKNSPIFAASLALREKILMNAIYLKEEAFLALASEIFDSRQSELIPQLVHALETLHTPQAVALLQEKARSHPLSFVRNWCNLALYKLEAKGCDEKELLQWVVWQSKEKMIEFRPSASWTSLGQPKPYDVMPQEESRLLI